MTNLDFDRASGFANAAIAMLRRSHIPAIPVYYELFYTYATGAQPELNSEINAILEAFGAISAEDASALCEKHLQISDMEERLRAMADVMARKITDVNAAIDFAMATADTYSGSLQRASGDLETGIDEDALKMLSSRLLKETRRMQEMNQRLEAELEHSKGDISVLQRDLNEVRRESMLDPLTKIPNRKSFDEQIAIDLDHARASKMPLSLLVFDIDNFKLFNDTYGHLTGDQVLRLVAQVLRANLKGRDMPARFGGEEFMAILPETALAGAIAVAENIRKSVQAKELLKRSTNEKLGRITLSVGVAEFNADDTVAGLIERADQCLYLAKRSGRNLVISERDLPSEQPPIGI